MKCKLGYIKQSLITVFNRSRVGMTGRELLSIHKTILSKQLYVLKIHKFDFSGMFSETINIIFRLMYYHHLMPLSNKNCVMSKVSVFRETKNNDNNNDNLKND